jgi:uncharacterized protein (DUF2062 family)
MITLLWILFGVALLLCVPVLQWVVFLAIAFGFGLCAMILSALMEFTLYVLARLAFDKNRKRRRKKQRHNYTPL